MILEKQAFFLLIDNNQKEDIAMKPSLKIYLIAVFCNLFWILLMFLAQQFDKNLPERHSIIPGTNQKFLHMQDFWTFAWGDAVGVSFIWAAFSHLAVYNFALRHWIIFSFLAIFFMAEFAIVCLNKNHKPDVGYPDIGKISWNGILHLPYFGFGASAAVFCVWLIAFPGRILLIFLAGVAIYFVFFCLEVKSGNFDPINKIKSS
jgi:hypothetical protein